MGGRENQLWREVGYGEGSLGNEKKKKKEDIIKNKNKKKEQ